MVKIRAMEIVIVIVVVLIVGLGLCDCKLAVGVSSFLLQLGFQAFFCCSSRQVQLSSFPALRHGDSQCTLRCQQPGWSGNCQGTLMQECRVEA